MKMTKRTDMNTQKIQHKLIFVISGIALLFMTAFPQMLWASHGERIVVNGFFGGLDLVFVDRLHGSHHNSSKGQNCNKKGRHGDYRPVVDTYYQDYRRPAVYREYRHPGYSRHHPRKHRHSRHNHYYKNKHRRAYHDHNSWRCDF